MADNTLITDQPGTAPYVQDDTRLWTDTYRVNGKEKPALLLRLATDANFIRNQFIYLPAYGQNVATQSICNIASPGQRIPGVLSWNATESLDNVVQQAQFEALDALPVSVINATITGFGVGAKYSHNGNGVEWTSTAVYGNPGALGMTSAQLRGSAMPAQWHSTVIRYTWCLNGDGISQQLPGICNDPLAGTAYNKQIPGPLDGNNPVNAWTDPLIGLPFDESNVQYRIFEPEVIYVNNIDEFPDPAIPAEEADQANGNFNQLEQGVNEWWDVDTFGANNIPNQKGVGAYYILVGQEVMRVTQIDRANKALYIIPGGRAAAGVLQSHNIGDFVTLLGHAPFTGDWAGFGYLMPDGETVEQSIMRPGNCLISYEGWGNPGDYKSSGVSVPLQKAANRGHNMQFTGYWFVYQPGASLDDSGVPKFTATLQSAGQIVQEQQISPDTQLRMSAQFDNWGKAIFDSIGHIRAISGTWMDYNNWDPSLPDAYPMKVSVQYAQHKDFFDHMNDTNFGTTCDICRQEWIDYVNNNEHGKPTGSYAETRVVGKHIYQSSIAVFNNGGQFDAGPLKTYGRLMTALAIGAWDNPSQADGLAQRWTKLPNTLFNNLNNWTNGRTWNGQLGFRWDAEGNNPDTGATQNLFDYSNAPNVDQPVYGKRIELTCAFESTYDRQPFVQPTLDLADLNRMTFTYTRQGFPVFIPTGHKLRGCPASSLSSYTPRGWFTDPQTGVETADTDPGFGEWFLSYGGAIDSYEFTLDPSGILTICYVQCTTCFDNDQFTVGAAGTGKKITPTVGNDSNQQLVWYSPLVGNKEALKLTGGVQQTDTVTLDQVLLGLGWNSKPASWSVTVTRNGATQAINALPSHPKPGRFDLYQDSDDAKRHPDIVRQIQQFVNFMLNRRYIGPPIYNQNGKAVSPLSVNEDGKWGDDTTASIKQIYNFLNARGYTVASNRNGSNDAWTWSLYSAVHRWLKANSQYIMTDPWWYVQNGLPWDEYVGAITGMTVPEIASPDGSGWAPDQAALQQVVNDWQTKFYKDAVNYGNHVVDEAYNKAQQKTVSTNYADPRIQLGDVIWASVPGYMSFTNAYGNMRRPFNNGIYVAQISRSMDLQQGTYSATYTGYGYSGYFDNTVMGNPNNYCTTKNNSL